MRIVVCGGGTAGHITPTLAVAQELKRINNSAHITYIGSGAQLEKDLISDTDLEYFAIKSGKFRRYRRGWAAELTDVSTLKKNIFDSVKISRGYFAAKRILRRSKAEVVFCNGGYVTVPVGLAAHHLNIPLVIHEADTVLGMSSKILAPYAKAIATGFPVEYVQAEAKYKNSLVFTGNPVRKELLSTTNQKSSATFHFTKGKPTLLIFGGSQGATAINAVVFAGLELMLRDYNIIHQVGSTEIQMARSIAHRLPEELKRSYNCVEFLKTADMASALFTANVAIIRPSASSIAEVAAHSIPTILIPSPYSANNHQAQNAKCLSSLGAARVLQQEGLTDIKLNAEIHSILDKPSVKKYLAESIHEFWLADSAARIAKIIVNSIHS